MMVKASTAQVEKPLVKIGMLDYIWRIYFAVFAANCVISFSSDLPLPVFLISLSAVVVLGFLPITEWVVPQLNRVLSILVAFALILGLVYTSYEFWGAGENARGMHVFSWAEIVLWGAFPIAMLPLLVRKLARRGLIYKVAVLFFLTAVSALLFLFFDVYAFVFFLAQVFFCIAGIDLIVQRFSTTRYYEAAYIVFYASGTIGSIIIAAPSWYR